MESREPMGPNRRQVLFATGAFAAVAAVRPQDDAAQEDSAQDDSGKPKPQFLFVQSARSASLADGTLTLHGVSPCTIYFSDRPERVAGHVETHHMIEAMLEDQDPDSFSKDPPNATLSVFDDEYVEEVVLELGRPEMKDDELVFPVVLLDGPAKLKGGPVSLFIDPIGRPLSPGSVAGVHRRTRRRTRRRVSHRW